MAAQVKPQDGQKSQSHDSKATKRKRMDIESDLESDINRTAPTNKRPCLELSLNLSSKDDAKALGAVESRYDIQLQSVLSSSKIQQRVSALLRHLASPSASSDHDHDHDHPSPIPTAVVATNGKPKTRLSILRARAPDAGKLISIAEIAKRELEKGDSLGGDAGHWYQYIALGEEKKERPRGEGRTIIEETVLGGPNAQDHNSDKDKDNDGDRDEEEDEDDFEVMKTPFERAIEGRPLVRAVPVMSLFLSRVSVEELKKRYGEQTNTLPISKIKPK
ncbi:hypothetical protein F5X99DRAFT_155034 [Biscogniauxia marginata]|nr:hypothetical protein F5X99DRAFT_155034 [Biscogniauxia marginata]